MRWNPLIRSRAPVVAILLALVSTVTFAKDDPLPCPHPAPRVFDTSGAAYVADTIFVTPDRRDQFVACLRARARRHWARLRDNGLLADVSVFETTQLRLTTGRVGWNFLILSHLRPGVSPAQFFDSADNALHSSAGGVCTAARGVEVRRIEALRPTPKSSYPRTSEADDREARDRKVAFIVEYIAVDDTPAALNQYRESMGQNMGPAMGLMIPEQTYFQLLALETEQVKYSQKDAPSWNQIHIRGFYPEKGADPEEMPLALRRVNSSAGRDFFADLNKIRTMPREDEARQLYELAIRRPQRPLCRGHLEEADGALSTTSRYLNEP